jgi:predicted SAM-dependent methyltransferase
MKLHIGCGHVILPKWVNLDIQPSEGVQIIDDARILNKIENNSCDIIYACHILEHISRNEVQKVLNKWFLKIKTGGKLRLAVPDFEKITQRYMDTKNLGEVVGLIIGGHKDEWDKHGMVFDKNILTNMLLKSGFKYIKEWDWRETDHHQYDDFSQAYLPHMEKDSGLLMSLNLEAYK